MLPRLAVFRSDRLFVNHMVLVDGENMKPLCIRNLVRHGVVLSPESEVTCKGCKGRGWIRSIGRFSGGQPKQDKNGRYIDWEEAARIQETNSSVSAL